ncbi:MAG: DsbA family protein [Patescibacteria group bacterium]
MSQGIQERIRESVYARQRRPWYSRTWGRILIVLGAFAIVFVVILAVRIVQVYDQISAGGGASLEFLTQLKQDARIDLLNNGDDPSFGPSDAPITIVAFEDFQCPFCLSAQPFIRSLETKYGDDVRFIYKDFPLRAIHPDAQAAAEAGQCAFEQGKFWEFHDRLFANQDRLTEAFFRTAARDVGMNVAQFNECFATGVYRQDIANDVELGRVLGVIGTPTFFINGEFIAQGYGDNLPKLFDEAIEFIRTL